MEASELHVEHCSSGHQDRDGTLLYTSETRTHLMIFSSNLAS